MNRSLNEIFSLLDVTGAHEVVVRTLHRMPSSEITAAILRETPYATYVASSPARDIGVDFAACVELVIKGARMGGDARATSPTPFKALP